MPQQASSKYLREMTWEEKARVNPLYAIMSVPDFSTSSEEPTEDELERFFAEGQQKANCWIMPWLRQTEGYEQLQVLEYGCGMGRLLRALADNGVSCCGVDISATMIDKARRYLPPTIEVRCLDDESRIPFPSDQFDRVFSYAVFQHISRRSMVQIAIREISRVLKPGGTFKLQFEMLYPVLPEQICDRGGSFAFENVTLMHGWVRKFGLPLWRSKFIRHNNWGGARLGYQQIAKLLRHSGLQLTAIETLPRPQTRVGLVWFHGHKK